MKSPNAFATLSRITLQTATLCAVLCVMALGVSASTLTKFNAPGAGTGAGQGTESLAISSTGVLAGYYIDSNDVLHGFARTTNGTITAIDAPGAGTSSGQGTVAYSINHGGTITGYYIDASGVFHG